MSNRNDLLRDFSGIQRDLARFIRLIDQEDLEQASVAGKDVITRLDAFVKEMQGSLSDDFFSNRLGNLQGDHQKIDSVEKKSPERKDLVEMSKVASRLSKNLRAVEALIAAIYPPSSFVVPEIFSRHWKTFATTALVGVIGFLAISFLISRKGAREGLTASFYAGRNFEVLEKSRIDPGVDFPWGKAAPVEGWRKDDFSVRWSGFVLVPTAGRWQFSTHSDDGVRLFIADKRVIDNWTLHGTTVDSVELTLEPGYYPIRMEYFDNTGDSTARLMWRGRHDSQSQPIPAKNLVPAEKYLKGRYKVFKELPASE